MVWVGVRVLIWGYLITCLEGVHIRFVDGFDSSQASHMITVTKTKHSTDTYTDPVSSGFSRESILYQVTRGYKRATKI